MRLAKLILAAIVGTLVLGVVAIYAGQATFLAQMVDPTFDELNEAAARNVDRWLEEARVLAAHPIFAVERPDRDAGELLNRLVPWSGDDLGEWEKGAPELELPDDARELLEGYPAVKDAAALTALSSTLSFDWMKALAQYGYWELTERSPVEPWLSKNAAMAPVPRYDVLSTWCKLRLWQAHLDGDMPAAVAEVRQLAWLALSNETLIGAMISVALYSIAETSAHHWGQGRVEELFTWEQKGLLRRVMWAGPGMLASPIEAATVKKALTVEGMALCVALNETVMVESLFWPRSLKTFPERSDLVVAAIERPRPGCRLSTAKKLFERLGKSERSLVESLAVASETTSASADLDDTTMDALIAAVTYVPGVDDTMIKFLTSIGAPGFVSRYEEERENPLPEPPEWRGVVEHTDAQPSKQ